MSVNKFREGFMLFLKIQIGSIVSTTSIHLGDSAYGYQACIGCDCPSAVRFLISFENASEKRFLCRLHDPVVFPHELAESYQTRPVRRSASRESGVGNSAAHHWGYEKWDTTLTASTTLRTTLGFVVSCLHCVASRVLLSSCNTKTAPTAQEFPSCNTFSSRSTRGEDSDDAESGFTLDTLTLTSCPMMKRHGKLAVLEIQGGGSMSVGGWVT